MMSVNGLSTFAVAALSPIWRSDAASHAHSCTINWTCRGFRLRFRMDVANDPERNAAQVAR